MIDDCLKCRFSLLFHVRRTSLTFFTRPILLPTVVVLALVFAAIVARADDQLALNPPEYSECGNVSINGVVITTPQAMGLVWDWGDGSKTTSMFPATHRYSTDGTYTVTVTAAACNTLPPQTTTAVISNVEDPPSCPEAGAQNHYYLVPYNMHLTAGTTSAVPLHVVDQDGITVSETLAFTINNPPAQPLVSISSSGYVTALRTETSNEIGIWVRATLNGQEVSNTCVVRVLPENYGVPFAEAATARTSLYYPTMINGENIALQMAQFQVPTVNEYAYQIESRLMATSPFYGGRQIFEVDFGVTEDNRVCGISGNPLRLGWNIKGNDWQNCFMVPFPVWEPPPPRSPQWGVFYHELGHNMTWASFIFANGLGHYFYSEGLLNRQLNMVTMLHKQFWDA
jgi:PKD repeat protein